MDRLESGLQRPSMLTSTALSGARVRNPAGEDLGTIDELMIDVESGSIRYAVLSFGGFLGIGDKLFAVPWHALLVDEDEGKLILNATKEQLEKAPGFDKDHWPDMADPMWGSQIHSHYGVRPYWESRGSEQ